MNFTKPLFKQNRLLRIHYLKKERHLTLRAGAAYGRISLLLCTVTMDAGYPVKHQTAENAARQACSDIFPAYLPAKILHCVLPGKEECLPDFPGWQSKGGKAQIDLRLAGIPCRRIPDSWPGLHFHLP